MREIILWLARRFLGPEDLVQLQPPLIPSPSDYDQGLRVLLVTWSTAGEAGQFIEVTGHTLYLNEIRWRVNWPNAESRASLRRQRCEAVGHARIDNWSHFPIKFTCCGRDRNGIFVDEDDSQLRFYLDGGLPPGIYPVILKH